MEDYSKEYRKKNKFVFELRYKPLLKILDEKGSIIESIQKEINYMYPFWQIENTDIIFLDNLELPKNEFVVGLKRMSVLIEDIATFDFFYDNVFKLVKLFYEITKIDKFSRIGCRLISLYEMNQKESYDVYLNKIENIFLKDPLKLDLMHTDLLVKVVHKNGFYQIGPIKGEELWVKQHFKDFSNTRLIPKNGIGFDIDSFGLEFEIRKYTDLNSKIDSTIKLTKSIEDALMKSLEM